LILNNPIAVIFQTLERGNLGRENLVHERPLLIPMVFKGGNGQFGFGLKSIIEATLIDTGSSADVVDAD